MKYEYSKISDIDKLNMQLLNCSHVQTYNPVLEKIFDLNESNYNKVVLKSRYTIVKFMSKISYNSMQCLVEDEKESKEIDVFIKYASLFDPVKYGMEKIDNVNDNLTKLPSFINNQSHSYIKDSNNTSYIDGLFTYLTSKLLNSLDFIHGIQFYGSFLGKKDDYRYDVYEELETIIDSQVFLKNRNKLFTMDASFDCLVTEESSFKKNIVIENIDCSNVDVDELKLDVDELKHDVDELKHDVDECDTVCKATTTLNEYILSKTNEEFILNKTVDSESLSSKSSNTTRNDSLDENDDDNDNFNNENDSTEDDDEDDDDTEDSDGEIPNIYMYIEKYPVNIIVMESLSYTLDELMSIEDLDKDNWASMFIQIIFTLITYQDIFSFTHNDLHTSNIMYKETDKEYLHYCYNGIYYKVPTYGKIWKIIDFGRSIYTVNSHTFFSNSFSKDGDAYSQYNTPPYFNQNNPIIKPNYSFDLCRLGCSLFDYFFDSIDDVNDKDNDEIQNLVKTWCLDYKGRNVLYKSNGEERYPEFKLYKMIARDVKEHTPHNQLQNPLFQAFQISSKKAKNKKILNIDEIKAKFAEESQKK